MTFRRFIRRHPWPVFLVLWTIGVAALVHWILQRPPAEPIIIRGNEPGDTGGWPLFDRSFHPVYPWLLLAPLVTALCLRFPIGLRRTCIALPLILLGGTAFVFLSLTFTRHYAAKLPPLTYISVQSFSTRVNASGTPQNIPGIQPGPPAIDVTYSFDLEKLAETLGVDPPSIQVGSSSISSQIIDNLDSKIEAPKKTLDTLIHLGGFVLIGGLAHLGSYFHHIKEREKRHANLSRELTEARLAGLHGQLRPHFLFNALNVIASEIHDKPDDATGMIVHLSDLLRSSLTLDNGRHLIPLRQELKMLDDYLAIQTRRFGDRLTVRRQFDPDTLDLPVPPFLLQPLVENALHHGLEPLARPGTLTLAARLLVDHLELVIEDDGLGLDPAPARRNENGSGTGLANIRRRLDTLFPGQHALDLAPASPAGGTRVTITLPLVPPENP